MTKLKQYFGPIFVASLFGLLAFGWWQRWNIYDYIRLRGYTPPERVVQLADRTTMDGDTRELFYVYYPALETRDDFRDSCPTGEVTIVLGCYVSGQGIYLADITDERLSGVVEVTAAHEVLHAAWERLSAKEKARLTTLLEAALKDVENERIQKNIEEYRANGADVPNELHSILGTEVRKLPAELEEYYKKYFTDRGAIVAYSEAYESAFTGLERQVENFDAELKKLQGQIDGLQKSLQSQEVSLDSQRNRLNLLLDSGQTEEYNAAVPAFNRAVNEYNIDVSTVRSLIDKYNDIVRSRNDVAVEQGELIEAIDSRHDTLEEQ